MGGSGGRLCGFIRSSFGGGLEAFRSREADDAVFDFPLGHGQKARSSSGSDSAMVRGDMVSSISGESLNQVKVILR